MITTPHFRVPFEIVGGSARVIEEGSDEEVQQNVRVILETFRGERLMVPEFGIQDPTFGFSAEVPDKAEISAQIERFEDRAESTISEAGVTNDGTANLRIAVGVKAVS